MKRRKYAYLVRYDSYRDANRIEHIITNIDYVFKKLDDAYHYIETYKNLYAIMTKSEVKDSLNKNNECNVGFGKGYLGYTFSFSIVKKPIY